MEENENESMSARDILSYINHFWVDGKVCSKRLNEAAENISSRAIEDPTWLGGTSFPDGFDD